ncbi:MAG: hypothetical protein K2J72_02860 [Oscillospiraceae bacterium]|nr:hypothetical protein [Oscillospiraceae bacterium]
MPYDNIYKMISEGEKHIKKYAKYKVSNKPVSAQIKIMPTYDPDADLAGLRLTIQSWIGFVDRVKNSGNSENSTSEIKMQMIWEKAIKHILNLNVLHINNLFAYEMY